ncbi:hypothetical protein DFQ26_003119 [Actinomortierella ambigua]|nr:hypothetical protein DFQ26_003119 [Actinomortierella ambigua]
MTKSIELRFEGASFGRTADPKVQKLMFPWTGVYGPRVKGQLVFRHHEDITLKALTLHFKAKISCSWSEKRGSKTHYFQAKKTLLEKEWTFLAKGDRLHLLKGNQTYTYDFDVALPVNLPNSLHMETGKIEYKFTANGKRQTFQLDMDTIRTVDIYQSLPPNHPHCLHPIQSAATFENALQYHVQIPHKAFQHGSTIPARVYLAPLAGTAARWHIKHVEVKLKEYFWFIVPEKGIRPEKRTLVSSKQDQWPKETGTVDRMLNINIPSFNIMSTTDTELIKCSHKLKFKFSVDVDGKTKKLSIDFDLYIPGPFPPGQMPAGYAPVGHQLAIQPGIHQPTVHHTLIPTLAQPSTCSQAIPLAGQPAVVAYGQQPYQFQQQQPYQALVTPLTPSGASSPAFPSPGCPPHVYPPMTPASNFNTLPQHAAAPPVSTPTPPTPGTTLTSPPTPSLPSYSWVNNYPTITTDQQHPYQSSLASSVSYPKPPTPHQQPQPPPPPSASSSPFMAAGVPPSSSTPKTSSALPFTGGNHQAVPPLTPTSQPSSGTLTQLPHTSTAPVPPPKPTMSPPPLTSFSPLTTLPPGSDAMRAQQSLAPPLPPRSADIKVLVDDWKHQAPTVTHSQNPQTIVASIPDPPRNPQQGFSQSELLTAAGGGALLYTAVTPLMSQYPQPQPPPASSNVNAAPLPGGATPTSSSSPTDALTNQLGQMGISSGDHFVPPPPPSATPAPLALTSSSSSSSSSPPNNTASPGGYTAPPLSPVTSQVMSPMTAAAAGAVVAATQATGQQQHPPPPPPPQPQQQQQQQQQQQHHHHQQQQPHQQQQHVIHGQAQSATVKRQQVWVPFYQTISGTTYVKYVPQHIGN